MIKGATSKCFLTLLLNPLLLCFVLLDTSLGQSQSVSLVGLKHVAVDFSIHIATSEPLDEKTKVLVDATKVASVVSCLIVLQSHGLMASDMEHIGKAEARLDIRLEFRPAPDSNKFRTTMSVSCVQWVQLTRPPQQKFVTVTWNRVSWTPFITTESQRDWGVSLAKDTLGRFIDDWKAVNQVANAIVGTGPPSPGQNNFRQQNQQKWAYYQQALAEYQEALRHLNSTQSLADARRGLSSAVPPPTDKWARLLTGLAPALENYSIRAAQEEVEIARQKLERAKAMLNHSEMNPLHVNPR